jgi:hypothetical protein
MKKIWLFACAFLLLIKCPGYSYNSPVSDINGDGMYKIGNRPQDKMLGISLIYGSFNYSQSFHGKSATLYQSPSYGVQADVNFALSDDLYFVPALGINFGSSYDDVAGDTIGYSAAYIGLNLKKLAGNWYYGGGVNLSTWFMDPSFGDRLTGSAGYQGFVGYYFGRMFLEAGYMTLNGAINTGDSAVTQSIAGPYIKIGYE